MSPTYRLPLESTAIAWTQLQSPGFSRPSAPLGTVHNWRSFPWELNFMNTWSFGGQPRTWSVFRQRIGEEPQTHRASYLVTQKPQGVIRLFHTSSSLPA